MSTIESDTGSTAANGHAKTGKGKSAIVMNGEAYEKRIPYSKIRVPKEFNLRGGDLDEKETKDLGESIKAVGLINPLLVSPDTDEKGEEFFWLRGGFRRHAAMKLLNIHRGDVRCTVMTFTSAAAAAMANAVENFRVDPKTADVAKRLYEFSTGTYPGAPVDGEGKPTEPVDRKVVCAQLGLSYSYAGAMIKAWTDCTEKVRSAWRSKDVPTDVIREIAKLKTPEEQETALAKWEAEGRKRKKKDKEAKGAKSDGGGDEDEGGGEAPGRKDIRELIAKWREKMNDAETGKPLITGKARDIAEAQVNVLRWVYGDLSRPPAFAK